MKLMMAEQIRGKTLFYVNEDTLRARKKAESSSTGSHTSKGGTGTDGRLSTSGQSKQKEKGLMSWFDQMGQKVNNAIVNVTNVMQFIKQREECERLPHMEQYSCGAMELGVQKESKRQRSPIIEGGDSAETRDPLPTHDMFKRTRRHLGHMHEGSILSLLEYASTASRAFQFSTEGPENGLLPDSNEQPTASESPLSDSKILTGEGTGDSGSASDSWVMERIPLEVRCITSFPKSLW